jgi:hypothetical protein
VQGFVGHDEKYRPAAGFDLAVSPGRNGCVSPRLAILRSCAIRDARRPVRRRGRIGNVLVIARKGVTSCA